MVDTRGFQAVILDLDGTLIDSNEFHVRAWIEALAAHGRPVEADDVRPLIGMGGDQLLPRLTGIAQDSELGRAISGDRKRIYSEKYFPRVRPFPRAAELVRRIHEQGMLVAVATSSSGEEMRQVLALLGIERFLHARVSKDEAPHSKPAPDLIETALRELGCASDRALMLGDTRYDIEAAARAGVPTVAFLSGGRARNELAGALAVYRDPADILERWDESPLGRASARRSQAVA